MTNDQIKKTPYCVVGSCVQVSGNGFNQTWLPDIDAGERHAIRLLDKEYNRNVEQLLVVKVVRIIHRNTGYIATDVDPAGA